MRARSRSGALPDDDAPLPARLFANVRATRGRRSAAWSSAGRRDWRRPALAGVVVAVVAGGAFFLASRPSGPGLTDPKAILDAATSRLSTARSVHVAIDLDGTVSLALFSPVGDAVAQPLTLTGTHAEGDIDLAAHQASLAFEVPALLGLTGRLVELPGGTYLNSTLTGEGWLPAGDGTGLPLPGGAPLAQLANLRKMLTDHASAATKLDDVACGSGTCYQVRITLAGDEARSQVLVPSAPASEGPSGPISNSPSADAAQATIVAHVDRESLQLAGTLLHLELGDGSTMDLDLRFSAWDAPVSIEPPTSAEVAPSASPAPTL